MRRLALLVAVGIPCAAALGAAPGAKLGLFAVRLAPGVTTNLPTPRFLSSLTDALRDDLQQADLGQVVPLPWPAALPADGRPTFETFVGLGREAGCNGVLVVTVADLECTEKSANMPLVGRVTNRSAKLRLTGGLVDVAGAAAVANIDLTEQRDATNDRGANPTAALNAGVGQPAFDGSVMGAVVKALRPNLTEVVTQGAARLQPAVADVVVARTDAPPGVAFELARWNHSMPIGFGRRATVAVVNRGREPRSFVIQPVSQPEGLIVAALGQGAPDEPCTLAPGQWKYVRLIFNAPQTPDGREVVLGLYAAPAGKPVPTTGEPADKSTVALSFGSPPPEVEFQVVGQDEATLVKTCRVVNLSPERLTGLRLRPDPDDGRVEITPSFTSNAIHGVVLPAGGSLTFQVVPHFRHGERAMDVTLRGYLGVARTHEFPLHFEVPTGMDWYLGTGHSTQYMSSSFESCVNQGDVLLDWGSVDGKMMFKCLTERDLGDTDPPFNWMEFEHRWLNYTWYNLLDLLGVDWRTPEAPPDVRCGDVRGATIRPNVAARLAGLDRDATSHPMIHGAKDWLGLCWYAPTEGERIGIYFRTIAHRERAQRIGYTRLSDPRHDARWPYLRTRYETSQAYAVWEEAVPGRGSDVAFCASGREMNHWRAPVLLTEHAAGVDDPVVHVEGESRVGVAWGDRRGGARRIYLRLSDDDGKTFAPELGPEPADGESQEWPQFVYTPTGLQLIWVSVRAGARSVKTCAMDAAGRPTGEPVVLSQAGADCGEPQVEVGEGGALYAVWREGDGDASEIQFAKAPGPGGPWSAARALTDDDVYSEYPVLGVDGQSVWVTWHTDARGLADLKYCAASTDGGETWVGPKAVASLDDVTEEAWLEVSFQMQWPRGSYKPFTTIVEVGGREVGRLIDVVPDGNYLFEVPPELVPTLASGLPRTSVRLKAEGCSGAHYLLATNTRFIIKRRFSQVPVVAGSQAEADALADRVGADLNHNRPDLALCANDVKALPEMLGKGTQISLPLHVRNVGEAPATQVRVVAYASDPREHLGAGQAPRLGEQSVGTLAAGQSKAITLEVTGQADQTARLYIAVTAREDDAYPDDNLWIEHFVVGEEAAAPPLVGTDVPNVLYAPSLLPTVHIPNVPALHCLLAQPNLPSLLGHVDWPLPPAPSLNGYLQQALSGLRLPNVPLPNVPQPPRVPRLPGLP